MTRNVCQIDMCNIIKTLNDIIIIISLQLGLLPDISVFFNVNLIHINCLKYSYLKNKEII